MQKDFLIVQFSILHHRQVHNGPCDSSCVNILNNFQRTKAIICFNLCLSPNIKKILITNTLFVAWVDKWCQSIAIVTHPIHPRGFVGITRQRRM